MSLTYHPSPRLPRTGLSRTVVARLLVLALGACSLTSAPPALAADKKAEVGDATRSAARKLGVEGVQAYEAGRYDLAMERLERAFKVLAVPSLGLWSARALEKNGKLIEAAERYLKTMRLPLDSSGDRSVQEQAIEEAAREHEALLPRIPNLLVEIEGADAEDVEVNVDGASINSALVGTPFPANPGKTRVVGTAGTMVAKGETTLVEGETATVVLRFGGAAASADGRPGPAQEQAGTTASPVDAGRPRSVRPVLGWGAVGLGAGGIAVGVVTGLMATDQFNTAQCEDTGQCPAGTRPETLDSINTLRTVSTVAFVAGGILAAGGITLLLLPPKKTSVAYVTPYVGTTTVGLTGKF